MVCAMWGVQLSNFQYRNSERFQYFQFLGKLRQKMICIWGCIGGGVENECEQ